jgi:tripartite-type tricarboxylate transporter receptor subunit TctC
MNMPILRIVAIAAAVAFTLPAAAQQKWPSKPIRIFTSTSGGPYDIVMRATGVPLSQALGQPVIVENRTGGSFVPVADGCAKSAPDGHSLCALDSFMMAVNPLLIANIPYNADKDFSPIILIGTLNAGLMVTADLPVKDLPDLLAQAKANPNKFTFATAGRGTHANLYVEYLRRAKGIEFVNIPYKSFLQGTTAVATGETNVAMFSLGASLNQAKAGKIRVLATAAPQRSIFAPDLPTFAESGIDVAMNTWIGMLGPAGMPREIVQRLNGEYRKIMADPAMMEKYIKGQGFEPTRPSGGTPEEFAEFIKADQTAYARAVHAVGLKPE